MYNKIKSIYQKYYKENNFAGAGSEVNHDKEI